MRAKHRKQAKQAFFVGLVCAVALLCVAMLSGCALTSAHADSAIGAQPMEATHTSDRTAGVALGTNCSNYVDTNNDGICDNCRGAYQSKSARDGSGNNGVCGNCGSNSGCGGYIDANNDGVCDNYDGARGNGGAYCDGTRHNENAKNGVQGSGLQNGAGFQHRAHHGNGHE